MKEWKTTDIPPQNGNLAIITGATGGLGYETALELARAGAEVIVTGRNEEKGRIAIEKIKRMVSSGNVRFEKLDLASLASVRAFAQKMLKEGRSVDLLINNAGVMQLPERRLTEDGFEMQFGTNHLGHFALTGLLLPLLVSASAPRVVNVSSSANRGAKIEFDNLQSERKYRPWGAYQQSKLANMLFTFELQRKSEANDWHLLVSAAHPGYALTDLIPNGPGNKGLMGMASRLLRPLSQSASDGALPTLFAATSPDVKPMGYYGPKNYFEMKGPVKPAHVTSSAKDDQAAARLWSASEQLTGVVWPKSLQR